MPYFPGSVWLTTQTVVRRDSSSHPMICLIWLHFALGKVVSGRSMSIQVEGFSLFCVCLPGPADVCTLICWGAVEPPVDAGDPQEEVYHGFGGFLRVNWENLDCVHYIVQTVETEARSTTQPSCWVLPISYDATGNTECAMAKIHVCSLVRTFLLSLVEWPQYRYRDQMLARRADGGGSPPQSRRPSNRSRKSLGYHSIEQSFQGVRRSVRFFPRVGHSMDAQFRTGSAGGGRRGS